MDAAHWRALRSLAQLALASGTRGVSSPAALATLRQLASGAHPSARLDGWGPDVTSALLPSLLQLPQPPCHSMYRAEQVGRGRAAGDTPGLALQFPVGAAKQLPQHPAAASCAAPNSVSLRASYPLPCRFTRTQDPFALLLQLLAGLLARPATSLACAAHTQPGAVMQALTAVLYPAAAGQAVCLAVDGSAPVTEVMAAAATSPPLASALEGAVAAQLLPWLQRVSLLAALLAGGPAPASPAVQGGAAAAAVASLLQPLRLPAVAQALQHPAAGALAPALVPPPPCLPGAPGTQLSMRAAQRQWEVAVRPPPGAARLLQLPASFQVSWQAVRGRLGLGGWPGGDGAARRRSTASHPFTLLLL